VLVALCALGFGCERERDADEAELRAKLTRQLLGQSSDADAFEPSTSQPTYARVEVANDGTCTPKLKARSHLYKHIHLLPEPSADGVEGDKVVLTGVVFLRGAMCTVMWCPPSKPDCNSCGPYTSAELRVVGPRRDGSGNVVAYVQVAPFQCRHTRCKGAIRAAVWGQLSASNGEWQISPDFVCVE